jgi:two-component system, NarL family, invasion response regulator UvrY
MRMSQRNDLATFASNDALWWRATPRQGATDKRVNSLLHQKNFPSGAMAKRAARAYTFSTREKHHMRILIADDHPIVRHGLKQMLAADPSATIVGEATNGDEALAMARKLEWDMAIFDFTMPGRSGLDLLGDMKKEFPGRPVLILSMHSEDVHGSRALRGGAAGYITKDSAPQELSTAVRKVANGGKYVSASLAEILASECSSDPQKALHEKLSDREYRVMWLLATGKQISEIAKEMGLSPSTVSTYRTRILRKLGLTSNAALVHYAVRHQLVG